MTPFATQTAGEWIDPEFGARWAARRAGRESKVLRQVWRALLARGERTPVEATEAAVAE